MELKLTLKKCKSGLYAQNEFYNAAELLDQALVQLNWYTDTAISVYH